MFICLSLSLSLFLSFSLCRYRSNPNLSFTKRKKTPNYINYNASGVEKIGKVAGTLKGTEEENDNDDEEEA
jgi:hypothetical protein